MMRMRKAKIVFNYCEESPKYIKRYDNQKIRNKSHMMLNVLGYKYTQDGLQKFQRDNYRIPDGIIGPSTYSILQMLFHNKCKKDNIIIEHIETHDIQSIMNENLYVYDNYGRVKRGDNYSIYNDLPYLDDILN